MNGLKEFSKVNGRKGKNSVKAPLIDGFRTNKRNFKCESGDSYCDICIMILTNYDTCESSTERQTRQNSQTVVQ